MQFKGRENRNRSPRDLFLFSLIQDGPRGIESRLDGAVDDLSPEDIPFYGVDWDEAEIPRFMNHLLENNPEELEANGDGTYHVEGTARRNNVVVDPPHEPFPSNYVRLLDDALKYRVDLSSKDMMIRRGVWTEALSICMYLETQM